MPPPSLPTQQRSARRKSITCSPPGSAPIPPSWPCPSPPSSPGALVSSGADWAARVAALTTSLQACAAAILLIVALIAAGTIAVATRSGLAQRREAIEIIHGLGALDADIAGRFAARAATLAAFGAAIGALLALPVLFWLATLAAPFAGPAPTPGVPALPAALWVALPSLPLLAAGIGWTTAQFTVRGWLRFLP
jgi:cell division transport system permease protein